MSAKYIAALAAVLALNACALQEHTDETIVTRTIEPGPGSATQPSTTVTDTIVKTTGREGKAPMSTGTTVTTTTITPVGSTSSTSTEVTGKVITPSSFPQPIIQPDMMR